jgi:adenosylcobinamide-phosphate synthase
MLGLVDPALALLLAAAVALAFIVDGWHGEPRPAWHPVVWMGRYLLWAGQRLAGRPPAVAYVAGALFWWAGLALVLLASAALQYALLALLPAWAAVLLLGPALKPLFAWALLRDEVTGVELALKQSLAAGRERLARLVSREVAALDEAQVRESAIESLAENLNDSLVAPLFWFALFGLPGAAAYRYANTADAMWGYRGLRHGQDWEWAGKWAARADDVLSWLPARLTAMLLAAANGGGVPLRSPGGLWAQARLTPSPNGGWPMAAMALAVGVRLGKPGSYQLNAAARAPRAADTLRALQLAARAAVGAVLAAALVLAGTAAGSLA